MNEVKLKPNENFKDGLFRMLFNDEEKIRELYSALEDKDCSSSKIDIVTLENAIWGGLKNDLAFIVDDKFIVLTEHQSTVNPNMPFRMAVYLMNEYERLYFNKSIYSTNLIRVPRPELYVFYNGDKEQSVTQELKFSDAYLGKCDRIDMEAVVTVINVNEEKGAEILKKCKTLREYSKFVALVKKKKCETGDFETAIKEAILECIEKNILREFLEQNGGKVVSVLYQALTSEEMAEIRAKDAEEEFKKETALNMLKEGIAIDVISRVTGLSEDVIKNLK